MTVAEAEELIKKGKILLQFVLYKLETAKHLLGEMQSDFLAEMHGDIDRPDPESEILPLKREVRALEAVIERARQLYGQDYVNACAPDGPIA